jgi:hypothetical protein
LPVLLLIGLIVWYWVAVVRVPGPSEPRDAPPAKPSPPPASSPPRAE